MKYADLTHYWIAKHNEHYYQYLSNYQEPRYSLKTFFLYSYYLFKTLGKGWEHYLVGYSNLFRRDPSSDYYKYRDPIDTTRGRLNSMEWIAAFEIAAEVGFPHNESAKRNFIEYSRMFLEKARKSPNSGGVDFMLSSAVAHLPAEYNTIREWLPSQLEKYLQEGSKSPHQLMIYLGALRECENQNDLRAKILLELIEWIKKPSGTSQKHVLIWARLIARMQWLEELSNPEIKQIILENFARSLDAVQNVDWFNSAIILEALYLVADGKERKDIERILVEHLAPAAFVQLNELFDFLNLNDDALDVENEVYKIKEKCKLTASQEECKDCMVNKKGNCWIRILSKLTHTEPKLHSGYEVADKVIYSLQQGVYVVVKAEEIPKQTGGGDVLYRQCGSLFSVDHALVLYLNAFDTSPVVIEQIKRAASTSKSNPRFVVIDQKFVRQIYRKYAEDEKLGK